VLTGQDLAGWRPAYERPVSRDLVDLVTVHKAGPWSQGPVLLQQLALYGFLDLDNDPAKPFSARLIHQVAEAAKLAFADREAWYGDDPDVPLDDLLGFEYNRQRAALITDQASYELRPGSPGGRAPRLPKLVTTSADLPVRPSAPGLGEPTVRRGDTCHLDVVDRWGNIVSATPSGGWLQSAPHIPEIGFCLGTRAQMFWLEEGLPNSLAPGKRPRTTLSPTLVTAPDTMLALGTPGGDQQDQWQLNVLLRWPAWNLQQAIDAPAWHTTSFPSSFAPRAWSPGELVVEARVGEAVLAELRERGHRVTVSGDWTLGRLSAAAWDGGLLRAAANARGMQGYAVGR
jgi:gamma-glutamyltranspeptidase/glutathione hydrolase